MDIKERIKEHLIIIYKENYADDTLDDILNLVHANKAPNVTDSDKWNEKDVILITYGDSIISATEKPLKTLESFLKDNLKNIISTVHILPFFPFSSDDGFSVIDYLQVNPDLGSWDDIEKINEQFNLMFDLVINHVSSQSKWFKGYLNDDEKYKDYFIEVPPNTDLSKVVRPRSLPLLTKFKTNSGEKYVWTTFSEDQIDLNFSNPKVLIEMIRVLLFYLKKGSKIIRLDAIAFLWKQIGTSCIHLPETHQVVKLLRDIMEYVNPASVMLTETNVPNVENLSYFGNADEAHMVYQFSLPPLLLYTLFAENTKYLNEWARNMPDLPDDNTFFNFTASHDGIGVRPIEGLLPEHEKEQLYAQIKKNGGFISTKSNPDGTESPYEMNITYFDALMETKYGPDEYQKLRFICSQTIMASMKGIPAFYIHSFTATQNYTDGVNKTGRARTINRMRWNKNELLEQLRSDATTSKVFNELIAMLKIRKNEKAFHPSAWQEIIPFDDKLFVIRRTGKLDYSQILSISNISRQPVDADITDMIKDKPYLDLLTGQKMNTHLITLNPYQTMWLKEIN
jgi:sucrose phosphorylase